MSPKVSSNKKKKKHIERSSEEIYSSLHLHFQVTFFSRDIFSINVRLFLFFFYIRTYIYLFILNITEIIYMYVYILPIVETQ